MRLPGDPAFADSALEREYRRDFAAAWRSYYAAGAVLLPTLFLAFAAVDATIASGDTLAWILTVRAATAAVLAGFVPVFVLRRFHGFYVEHMDALLTALASVAVAGLLGIGGLLAREQGQVWLEASTVGLLVAMAFVYGASRLRYPVILTLASTTTVAAFTLLATSSDVQPAFVAAAVFHAVVTHALGLFVASTLEADDRQAFLRRRELSEAQAQTERLLHLVLHPEIGERMRHTAGRTFAEVHPAVTVILADLSGFTPLCSRLEPDRIGELLDEVFGSFDELCERHAILKIKTLGDAWLAVSGLPHARPDPASAAADLAADMVEAVRRIRARSGEAVGLRIGIASGPVVAGVIGRTRYAYDVWGTTVRQAAAMEAGGEVDRVRLDDATAAALGPDRVVRDGEVCWLRS